MDNDNIIFLMFIGITVIAFAMLAIISKVARKKSGLDHAHYQKRWAQIEQLSSMGENGWQVAIMNADSLLDQALKTRGFHGETMGERLKSASKNHLFRNNDAIWSAHKLRNRLAHEPDVKLNQVLVRRSLGALKSGLKDAGAL